MQLHFGFIPAADVVPPTHTPRPVSVISTTGWRPVQSYPWTFVVSSARVRNAERPKPQRYVVYAKTESQAYDVLMTVVEPQKRAHVSRIRISDMIDMPSVIVRADAAPTGRAA